MRVFLVLAALLATTPIVMATPAQCALSGSAATPPTPSAPTSPTTSPPPAAAQAPAAPVRRAASLGFRPARGGVRRGDLDLGASHGLRRVVARTGDQFMIFQVAPDGSAAVSGAPVEIAPNES